MNQTLDKWDTLISETLDPHVMETTPGDPGFFQSICAEADAEKNIIRKYLVSQTYAISNEKEAEAFIARTQALLGNLQDKLYRYRQSKITDARLSRLYECLSAHIQFLLEYIETDFRKYFNPEEKVPYTYLAHSKREIAARFQPVKEILAARAELDHSFVQTLTESIEKFCGEENTDAKYRDLVYHKELIKELLRLGEVRKQDCMYTALKESLIYMDFNSPSFINYFLTQFRSFTTVEEIARHRFEISLMHVKPNYRLHPERPSVKQSLLAALEKETEFLLTVGTERREEDHPTDFFYVNFKGTEIYLLIKALVDAGGLTHDNYKSAIEKLAPRLANRTQKGFSAESLSKYSHKVDPASKESVKRFLMRMIRNIDSYD